MGSCDGSCACVIFHTRRLVLPPAHRPVRTLTRRYVLFSLKKMAATAAGTVLSAGSLFMVIAPGWAAAPAGATTLTCTNIAGSTAVPLGCGGLQSATTAHGTLDLAVLGTGTPTGNYFNSPVGVQTADLSNTREDFTVFAVSGKTTGGPGNLGEYVAMYTPNGKIPGFVTQPAAGHTFTANSSDLCLSVVTEHNGPGGAARWNTVLRNCNTNGTFTIGTNTATAPTTNAVTPGHANGYQVWAPVTGANGLLMVNETLSHGFKSGNTQYVLDIKGAGGPGSGTLAYPENDGLNQEWSVAGCTEPVTGLSTGYQFCP